MSRLRQEADDGGVALGVDAPIGLPAGYAARHAGTAADFVEFLAGLAPDGRFFQVCDLIEQVDGAQPFYPRTVRGGPRRGAHAARLGLTGPDALLRRCDRQTPTRPQAAPLFWTLGANQVGKAALALWREVLLPGLSASAPVRLWPFAGPLETLSRPGCVAVAETYPAEAMRQLGLAMGGSKRRQADRQALGPALRARLAQLDAIADPALLAAIADGFDADLAGEDRFDSLVGLLGMLQVLADPVRDRVPLDETVRRWEGWILGQPIGP